MRRRELMLLLGGVALVPRMPPARSSPSGFAMLVS
jgi:hypothetical protein